MKLAKVPEAMSTAISKRIDPRHPEDATGNEGPVYDITDVETLTRLIETEEKALAERNQALVKSVEAAKFCKLGAKALKLTGVFVPVPELDISQNQTGKIIRAYLWLLTSFKDIKIDPEYGSVSEDGKELTLKVITKTPLSVERSNALQEQKDRRNNKKSKVGGGGGGGGSHGPSTQGVVAGGGMPMGGMGGGSMAMPLAPGATSASAGVGAVQLQTPVGSSSSASDGGDRKRKWETLHWSGDVLVLRQGDFLPFLISEDPKYGKIGFRFDVNSGVAPPFSYVCVNKIEVTRKLERPDHPGESAKARLNALRVGVYAHDMKEVQPGLSARELVDLVEGFDFCRNPWPRIDFDLLRERKEHTIAARTCGQPQGQQDSAMHPPHPPVGGQQRHVYDARVEEMPDAPTHDSRTTLSIQAGGSAGGPLAITEGHADPSVSGPTSAMVVASNGTTRAGMAPVGSHRHPATDQRKTATDAMSEIIPNVPFSPRDASLYYKDVDRLLAEYVPGYTPGSCTIVNLAGDDGGVEFGVLEHLLPPDRSKSICMGLVMVPMSARGSLKDAIAGVVAGKATAADEYVMYSDPVVVNKEGAYHYAMADKPADKIPHFRWQQIMTTVRFSRDPKNPNRVGRPTYIEDVLSLKIPRYLLHRFLGMRMPDYLQLAPYHAAHQNHAMVAAQIALKQSENLVGNLKDTRFVGASEAPRGTLTGNEFVLFVQQVINDLPRYLAESGVPIDQGTADVLVQDRVLKLVAAQNKSLSDIDVQGVDTDRKRAWRYLMTWNQNEMGQQVNPFHREFKIGVVNLFENNLLDYRDVGQKGYRLYALGRTGPLTAKQVAVLAAMPGNSYMSLTAAMIVGMDEAIRREAAKKLDIAFPEPNPMWIPFAVDPKLAEKWDAVSQARRNAVKGPSDPAPAAPAPAPVSAPAAETRARQAPSAPGPKDRKTEQSVPIPKQPEAPAPEQEEAELDENGYPVGEDPMEEEADGDEETLGAPLETDQGPATTEGEEEAEEEAGAGDYDPAQPTAEGTYGTEDGDEGYPEDQGEDDGGEYRDEDTVLLDPPSAPTAKRSPATVYQARQSVTESQEPGEEDDGYGDEDVEEERLAAPPPPASRPSTNSSKAVQQKPRQASSGTSRPVPGSSPHRTASNKHHSASPTVNKSDAGRAQRWGGVKAKPRG